MIPVEQRYTKEERRYSGIYYTPHFLSEYLAQKILYYFKAETGKKSLSIADPACGNSILLQSLVREIQVNRTYSVNCYGIDKDPEAIERSGTLFRTEDFPETKSSFIHTDGLFPYNEMNSADGWEKLKKTYNLHDNLDIIVSNPPWGADLSEYTNVDLSSDFTLAKGQFDIYDLFIEIILANLKEGGMFGIILPDSVFSLDQHRLREILVRQTTIHLIARLGEKIFPEINRGCTIIIGCNQKPDAAHLVDCFHLTAACRKQVLSQKVSLNSAEEALSHQVPQTRFEHNANYIFDIDSKTTEENILKKFETNTAPLKKFVQNTRGVEISKKGRVCQCPECNKWQPYPISKTPKCRFCSHSLDLNTITTDYIIQTENLNDGVRMKTGEDLYRYTSTSKSWINTNKDGINYKDLSIYQGTKILVRKTGIGITACIDYDNSITCQVVYMLKLKDKKLKNLTLEFILAILNSRAMTYYLIKKYGENEWRTHPYLTQTTLINLPIPNLDFDLQDIKDKVEKITKIIRTEVAQSDKKNISQENDIYIEKMIASLYQLNKEDYRDIFDTLNSAEQLIPMRRLVECNINDIFN